MKISPSLRSSVNRIATAVVLVAMSLGFGHLGLLAAEALPDWLKIKDGRVDFAPEGVPSRTVAEGSASVIPGYAASGEKYFPLQIGEGLLIVTADGSAHLYDLPSDAAPKTKWTFGPAVTAENHSYRMLQIPAKEGGEAYHFVIRNDGAYYDLKKGFATENLGLKYERGSTFGSKARLVFNGHELLMTNFDSGASQPNLQPSPLRPKTQGPNLVSLGAGGPTDPTDLVQKSFVDFGEQVRAKPETVFPIDPNTHPGIRKIRAQQLTPQSKPLMIVGDSGSGRTELLRSFVQLVQQGRIGEFKPDTVFLRVDPTLLETGSGTAGAFDAKIEALKTYAKELASENRKLVLLLDNAERLIGVGAHRDNSSDFYTRLAGLVETTDIDVIGTTTEGAFAEQFKESARSLFEPYRQPSFTRAQLPKIVKDYADLHYGNGKRYTRVIPDALISEIVDLALEYDTMGSDVRKAVELYKQLSAELTLDGVSKVDSTLIRQKAFERYQVKEFEYNPEARVRILDGFKDAIGGRLKGDSIQGLTDLAYDSFRNHIYGASNTGRGLPGMRFLLLGPPGVGKTAFVAALAEATGLNRVRITMSGIASKEELYKKLHAEISKDPTSIIFLDELEKAPIAIQDSLLSALDEGKFTFRNPDTNEFVEVKLKRTNIVAASNAGGDEIKAAERGFKWTRTQLKDLATRMNHETGRSLSQPLVDRFAEVLAMEPPRTAQERLALAQVHANRVIKEQTAALARDPEFAGFKLQSDDTQLNKWLTEITKDAIDNRDIVDMIETKIANEIGEQKHEYTRNRGVDANRFLGCLVRVLGGS